MLDTIFIPGNTPSLKNSKIKTARGIFPSKTVTKYLRELGIQQYSLRRKEVKGYVTRENKFAETKPAWMELVSKRSTTSYPYIVHFHFVRNSKRLFDFHNAVQIVADLMIAHDFLEDDDMAHFIPMPMKMDGKWYTVDKENPGVYIKVN